jgi:hypothetical protein
VQVQVVRQELTKLKNLLHEITDADRAERDEPEVVRMETKLTKKIGQFFGLLSLIVIAKCSGSLDYRVIWEQFNTSEDHPANVTG